MSPTRALYSLLIWCTQPLLLRRLRRRARAEPGYARAMGERFGHYAPAMDSLIAQHAGSGPPERLVWLHAVSLGETRAAAGLLAQLRAQLPGMRLLLTHGTASGRAEGEKLLQAGDVQVWLPWDTRGAVARFLCKFRPTIGVLIETEVWPNLAAGCAQHGVPLVLVNARMGAQSLRRAQRLAALARPAYAALTAVWAQTDADAQRLRAIGAPVRGVFGNLKFDLLPDSAQLAQGRAWRALSERPVVMLASSRAGEEAMWLEKYMANRPDVQVNTAFIAIKNVANGGGAEAAAVEPSTAATTTVTGQASMAAAASALPAPAAAQSMSAVKNVADGGEAEAAVVLAAQASTTTAAAATVQASMAAAPDAPPAASVPPIASAAPAPPPPATAQSMSAVQWLIVPRHPQRFDEVWQLLTRAGLAVSRRSDWGSAPGAADVWLGDSLGEMALYYGMADAALLGGSFAPLGGQNLIEAAACGCPVLAGPHTANFAQAASQACAAGAAQRAPDMAAGIALALQLALDASAQAAASACATRFAGAHRGAAQATAQAVVGHIRRQTGGSKLPDG